MFFKRAIRGILENAKVYISLIIILSIGLMTYTTMMSITQQIFSEIEDYYNLSNFADIFSEVISMPEEEVLNLQKIEGIKSVNSTISKEVKADIENYETVLKFKLVGVNSLEETQNNKYIINGNKILNKNDILVNKDFFNFNKYEIGSKLNLIINGKKETFTIVGTFKSPEYLYPVSEIGMLANPKSFAVGLVKKETMEDYFNLGGLVTNIDFELEDNVPYDSIKFLINEKLDKFGLIELFHVDDQSSNFLLVNEVAQLAIIGIVLPLIFIFVTISVMFIMIKRIINKERKEIGTLKAFGFDSTYIMFPYIINILVISLGAFALSLFIGNYAGGLVYSSYRALFDLDADKHYYSVNILLQSLVGSIFLTSICIIFSIRDILKIHPAESMRISSPTNTKFKVRMPDNSNNNIFLYFTLNNLLSNNSRTIFSIFSIAISFSLVNVMVSLGEATRNSIINQNEIAEVYDIKVVLNKFEKDSDIKREFYEEFDVTHVETIFTAPIQIIYKNNSKNNVILASSHNNILYKIRDVNNNFYSPNNGLLINTRIANELGVNVGDIVEIKSQFLKENKLLPVEKIISEPRGTGIYISTDMIYEIFGEDAVSNNVLINVDKANFNKVQKDLSEAPNVHSVLTNDQIKHSSRMIFQGTLSMVYMFIVLTFFVTISTVYSITSISIDENMKDFLVLRVIGYRPEEVNKIKNLEQSIILFIGIILGFLPSIMLSRVLGNMFSSDFYTIHVQMSTMSILIAALVCFISVNLSNFMSSKSIEKNDIALALKGE